MASFLDKLKKGMGMENLSEDKINKDEEEPEENQPQPEITEEKVEEKEKKVRKKRAKKPKEETKITMEKEPKVKKIKIEGEDEFEEKTKLEQPKDWFEPEGQLAVDVFQTDGEIVIQSAVAGIKPEELDISIENDVVSIKGNREKTFKEEGTNYFYQECYWGRFSREIILPAEVDPSRVEASMKNGILTIRMPKIEKEKKRKIAIKE